MALTNNKVTSTAKSNVAVAPAPAQVGPKGKRPNEVIIAQGNEIIAAMSEDERTLLGSKSHTLKFIDLLGLASKRSTRRVSKDESKDCSTPVGLKLVSSEPIEIPQIDIRLDKDTGIDYQKDITYRKVEAGEEFILSYYEFMFLITRPEYANVCATEEDPQGVVFVPKLPAYYKGTAKLPTPTVNLRSGAIKASIIDIDEKDPDGRWKIKEEYAEKFGPLLKSTTPRRAGGNRPSIPSSTAVSVAMHKILSGATRG